ncbi:MAG: hypothetical protein LBJ00_04250 [Planctomycetaceae bacterium]|nr:hypothetical protein [Planctomycetaceae bacterium]
MRIDSTSCQCSSATTASEKLAYGEETVLAALVKLDNKYGRFCENIVLISTCDEEEKKDSFFLAGTVIRDDIVSSKRIFAGSLPRGGSFEESFVVKDQGNGQLRKVEVNLPVPVTWMDLEITCADVTEVNQHKNRKLDVRQGDRVVTLLGEIKKDATIQDFELPIVVQTNLGKPLDAVKLSLEGKIVPTISIEPVAIIFLISRANIARPYGQNH